MTQQTIRPMIPVACPHCDKRIGTTASAQWVHLKVDCPVLNAKRNR